MMEKDLVRTDLASEWSALGTADKQVSGLFKSTRTVDGVQLHEVQVQTAEASRLVGKACGRYLTLFVGRVWQDSTEVFRKKTLLLARELRRFLPSQAGCVLLVGLGNRHITADAVGPLSIEHALVTRHLEKGQPSLFQALALSRTAAISPGVLGQTGIESADIIGSLVQDLQPSAVVCVDALASRSLARLATTVQISDTGIAPGSGVGNRRDTLNQESLGVPVCAIGVPTVVDAATLAYDVLQSAGRGEGDHQKLEEVLGAEGLNFFVAPKETDEILREVSALVGYAINLALHPRLSYEEMLSLVG